MLDTSTLDQAEVGLKESLTLDEEDDRVRASAERLFERLNPASHEDHGSYGPQALPIYDWEIAADTQLSLAAVRSALRHLDENSVVVTTVNDEHSVTALAS